MCGPTTIIAQSIPDVAAICLMDYPVTDFSDETSSLRALETHLLHHDKHYMLDAGSLEYLQRWEELADILLQGKPLAKNRIITVLTSIVSPLCMENINMEMLLFAARQQSAHSPGLLPDGWNHLPVQSHGNACPDQYRNHSPCSAYTGAESGKSLSTMPSARPLATCGPDTTFITRWIKSFGKSQETK